MSHEEAERQREAEEAAAAAAAASAEQEKERVSSWNSSLRRKSASVITPIACCKPPSPTTGSSGKAPEHEGISHKAEKQAEKAASHGVLPESEVPTRILATTKIKSSSAPAIPGAGAASSSSSGAILPVVVEAPGEASSTGDGEAGSAEVDEGRSSRRTDEDAGPSQINQHHKGPHGDDRPGSEAGDSSDDSSDDDDNRPLTPVKDGSESAAGFGNPVFLSSPGRRQQRERQRRARAESSGTAATAATTATTVVTAASPTRLSKKPESADSGYGTAGGGGSGASSSLCAPPTPAAAGPSATASAKQKVRQSISRESLDKALPPLPISAGETMNLPHRLGKP